MWTTTVQPVVIALMVVLEVAVWQVRVALATRPSATDAAMTPVEAARETSAT